MDTVNKTNRLQRSWGGPCSRSMRDDLKYILDIFRTSFERDIIKKNEYRKYLIIITNNCNDYIQTYLHIDEKQLENKILLIKNIKYLMNNHHLLYKEKKFTRISETEDTFHSFLNNNDLLNDSNLKYIFNLLNYPMGQFSVYIYISKVGNNYKIYNLKNVDLTDTVISSITKKFRVQHSNRDSEELTYKLKVGLTYYKTKRKYDLTANRDFEEDDEEDEQDDEEDEQDDEEDDEEDGNNSPLLSTKEMKIIQNTIAKHTAKQTAKQTGANGGYAKSSKFKTKEVLGKLRRVYKIPNSKKEHIKHKGNLITVSEYKAVMKLKNKIYK